MSSPFHRVIALHESQEVEWEKLSREIPFLPRGWFELSRLPVEDRIEFTRDFWMTKLPIRDDQTLNSFEDFFSGMDDVGVFAVQMQKTQPFDVHMVYSLKEESGFFQGSPPAPEEGPGNLEKQFSPLNLPPDYLAFLQIHDGFSKYTDTGLLKIREMARTYQRFQEALTDEPLIGSDGQIINPSSLIPFYESFNLHCYQCFYADWYPEDEMGNIYFSNDEPRCLEDLLAFPTFLDWLLFYLKGFWG